jgi:hypothetical protein
MVDIDTKKKYFADVLKAINGLLLDKPKKNAIRIIAHKKAVNKPIKIPHPIKSFFFIGKNYTTNCLSINSIFAFIRGNFSVT